MAHSLYTTHHIHARWVAFALAAALAMASVVWMVAFLGDRVAADVDRDGPQIAPPAIEYSWPAWSQSPRPFGITDLPGRVGLK
jgi:hypothetical protein